MELMDLLAKILNPNPGVVNQMTGTATGLGPEQLARYHQQSGMGVQAASPAAFAASPAPMMPQQAAPAPQQAQAAPSGGGIGGFLGGLFQNPETRQKNQTVEWLTGQGMDQGTATMLASHKPSLQAFLLERAQGGNRKPLEVNGRLVDPNTYEVLADFSDKGGSDWSKLDDGRLFNQGTGEIKEVGRPEGGGQFEGTSVEAQSLNHLVRTGQLTKDQAAQLGAGKTITNPADGSITFLTPQGVFGQSAQGGPPQPLTPDGSPAASAPADPSVRPGIIPLTEGKPGKLATEGERRNRSLYSVVAPELKVVETNFAALADIKNQAYSRLPLSEYVTTPEYQQAANSLQTIVSSYLYSVSGATATPDEVKKQTDILTPRPGEAKASIDNKLRRVRTMVDAIRQSGGQWEPEAKPDGQGKTPPIGETRYGYRFKGGDPSEPSNWEKAN